jgi:uncharacterized membrane protein
MATILSTDDAARRGLPPTKADTLLGYLAIVMLLVMLAAIARGHDHWQEAPALVWCHLALLLPALALTPIILTGRKGSDRHRLLGWIWSLLMLGVAIESFAIPVAPRRFSAIWVLSVVVLVTVPRLILAARRHRVAQHRTTARAIVIGAFLIAGFFTLPFGRMLGRWLFLG